MRRRLDVVILAQECGPATDRPKLFRATTAGRAPKVRNTASSGSGTLARMAREKPAKRIVLATFGSPGDLYPFLAIGADCARVAISPSWRPASSIAVR